MLSCLHPEVLDRASMNLHPVEAQQSLPTPPWLKPCSKPELHGEFQGSPTGQDLRKEASEQIEQDAHVGLDYGPLNPCAPPAGYSSEWPKPAGGEFIAEENVSYESRGPSPQVACPTTTLPRLEDQRCAEGSD